MDTTEKQWHEVTHAVGNEGMQRAGETKMFERFTRSENSHHFKEARRRYVAATFSHATWWLFYDKSDYKGEN